MEREEGASQISHLSPTFKVWPHRRAPELRTQRQHASHVASFRRSQVGNWLQPSLPWRNSWPGVISCPNSHYSTRSWGTHEFRNRGRAQCFPQWTLCWDKWTRQTLLSSGETSLSTSRNQPASPCASTEKTTPRSWRFLKHLLIC